MGRVQTQNSGWVHQAVPAAGQINQDAVAVETGWGGASRKDTLWQMMKHTLCSVLFPGLLLCCEILSSSTRQMLDYCVHITKFRVLRLNLKHIKTNANLELWTMCLWCTCVCVSLVNSFNNANVVTSPCIETMSVSCFVLMATAEKAAPIWTWMNKRGVPEMSHQHGCDSKMMLGQK